MYSNFFIATNLDEIDSVIDALKKARKDMRNLSEENENLDVRVKLRTSTIGELKEGEVTYSKEFSFE